LKSLAWPLLLVPTLVVADDVYLKGAGSISGRITELTDTMVMVDNGDGTIGVPLSRVERIVQGRSPLDEFDERAAKLGPKDVAGWRSLGRWAAEAGISTQSDKAYRKVLDIAPGDREAREALGFVFHNGRWMTEEDSFRARGYVKYEGEWMTPAEMQAAQADAAAEQARREAEQRAVDAEIAQAEAEQRAHEAEQRAEEAEEEARRYQDPVYWGGWGYGLTYWPVGTAPRIQ
jgi:hypothetical protein